MPLFQDLFGTFLNDRIGLFHTALHITDEGSGSAEEQNGKFPVLTAGRSPAVLQMKYSGKGDQRVSRKIDHQSPYENIPKRRRDQAVQEEKERVPVSEGNSAQDSPKQGVLKTDISVKIPFLF